MPQTSRLSTTKLVDLFALQLWLQEAVTDAEYEKRARKRDAALRRLNQRQMLQTHLATGILSRLCEQHRAGSR